MTRLCLRSFKSECRFRQAVNAHSKGKGNTDIATLTYHIEFVVFKKVLKLQFTISNKKMSKTQVEHIDQVALTRRADASANVYLFGK